MLFFDWLGEHDESEVEKNMKNRFEGGNLFNHIAWLIHNNYGRVIWRGVSIILFLSTLTIGGHIVHNVNE